ncbi:MAG: cytochrome c biogenesis protein DipZ [Microbacterium ginsengisoli]|nr:cytochrome c biogenesis protein DipZ [Microbacterium ginsengisoli]
MTLVIIGLLGGLITGISPCILPVLPVIFLTGGVQASVATGDEEVRPASRWRPFLVIAGLVLSFTVVTLVGSLILGLLNLPQDIIRWVGIVVLILIGIGLIVPRFERILEKPFTWLPQKEVTNRGSGFGVGLALGAVFVPCAGPVLAAIIVAGSTGRIGADTILLTVSFAIGVAVPLLVFALAGRAVVQRIRAFRTRERLLRIIGGSAMIALSVGLVFNVPQLLQQLVPDYTSGLQQQLTDNPDAQKALALGGLVNDENKNLDKCTAGATELESCGTAPSIKGIQQWFNTPNDQPITLSQEKGKVVLIDFWAYSCINCQRSIPHVVAWNKAYASLGLEVIGIHSPEYAFEKDPANVMAGAKNFGITYPVAIDNNLDTWTNYRNRYWPAHYLIDAQGVVRNIQFGEGNYATTENLIRQLLVQANPNVQLPPPTEVQDTTPQVGSTTQETFLGAAKQANFGGGTAYDPGTTTFAYPASQPDDSFVVQGSWNLTSQSITPGTDQPAQVRLRFHAGIVQMVLGGTGTVTYTLQGGATQTVQVSGTPNAYQLVSSGAASDGQRVLEVTVSPGVQAYSFTFG